MTERGRGAGLAGFALAWAAAACASAPEPSPPAGVTRGDVVEIQYVVLRELLREHLAEGAQVACLSAGAWVPAPPDPAPADLVRRAFDAPVPVVASSECEVTRQGDRHRPTGRPAQLFHVSTPDAADEETVHVDARHHVHGLHGASFTCEVVRRQDGWAVRACVMTGIS